MHQQKCSHTRFCKHAHTHTFSLTAPYIQCIFPCQGASSTLYKTIKSMAHSNPALLDGMLSHLADAMAEYMCYQIESGAQVGGRRHSLWG